MKIFLFHRIHPKRDLLWDPIDPKLFERQIIYLNKKYCLVNLENYLLSNNKPNPSKKVASIVFDDGYKDFLDYAYPILKKYNIPCSMYIVTDSIDKNIPIWTYSIDYLFQHTSKNKLTFKVGKELGFEDIVWNTTEQRLKYAKDIKPKLKAISDNKRRILVNEISENFNDVEHPNNLFLTWDEIRFLKSEGIEIGSHTVSHPMLGNIQDIDILNYELTHSAQRIYEELTIFPKTISYPIGSYNDMVKIEAEKVGYKLGLAVNQCSYNIEANNLFEISRIELYNESMLKTKLRINEIITKIKRIIGR